MQMRFPWGDIGQCETASETSNFLLGVPSWELSAILEPLELAPEQILTFKVTLLLALTSLKRVGDLQDLSVSEMCMDFAPGLVKVTLRPRPAMFPRFYPHRFALRSSHFTLSILLPLLQARTKVFTCSVLSEL